MTALLHRVITIAAAHILICSSGETVYAQRSVMRSLDCDLELSDRYIIPRTLKSQKSTYPIDTVTVTLITDYYLYQKYGGDTMAMKNYVSDLWDHVAEIYAHDGIPLILSDIRMWITADPFDHTTAALALRSLAAIDTSQNSHLTHLLSGSPANTGGIAYLNGYCEYGKGYGYANVNGVIDTTLDYNWDIHVLAHEIGHNLGAPHTNNCVWGPNGDTALDGCSQTDINCNDADIPLEGGSIMSSCHQYSASVRMDRGVGDEPAALMKSFILSCSNQQGLHCDNPIVISEKGAYTIPDITIGQGAHNHDATHSKWYQYITTTAETIVISSCNQGVDTRLHAYQGDCNKLSLRSLNDDDCNNGVGHLYASYLEVTLADNDTILIEWDNRWSEDGFTFSLFSTSPSSCNNGILDHNEDSIDCGGICPDCLDPCTDLVALQPVIDHTAYYLTMDTLHYDGIISASANVTLGSNIVVNIDAGFEVQSGAQVKIIIDDCRDDTPSLSNE